MPHWLPAVSVSVLSLFVSVYMARRAVADKWLQEHDERLAVKRDVERMAGLVERVHQLETRGHQFEAKCNERHAVNEVDLRGIRENIGAVREMFRELVERFRERERERTK